MFVFYSRIGSWPSLGVLASCHACRRSGWDLCTCNLTAWADIKSMLDTPHEPLTLVFKYKLEICRS
ncbi:hypothetical protein BDV10DRAFT_177063 [Aspergillus recurvatus]